MVRAQAAKWKSGGKSQNPKSERAMPEITGGPSQGFPIPGSSGPVDGANSGSYCGFTAYETSGSTRALVILYDNDSASGDILEIISLNANESSGDNYPRPGRQVLKGIYAEITGSVEGSVFQ